MLSRMFFVGLAYPTVIIESLYRLYPTVPVSQALSAQPVSRVHLSLGRARLGRSIKIS